MPIRPFPFSFGTGIDICKVSRIHSLISQGDKYLHRFIKRVLTPRERRYLQALYPNIPGPFKNDVNRFAQYMAGRWAAKEAAIKAVKPRRVTLMEVEIWPSHSKEPFAVILSKAPPTESAESTETADELETGRPLQADSDDHTLVFRKINAPEDPLLGDEVKSVRLKSVRADEDLEKTREKSKQKNAIMQGADQVLHDLLNEDCGGQIARLSISHDGDYACAVVIAMSEPASNDVGGEAAARELS